MQGTIRRKFRKKTFRLNKDYQKMKKGGTRKGKKGRRERGGGWRSRKTKIWYMTRGKEEGTGYPTQNGKNKKKHEKKNPKELNGGVGKSKNGKKKHQLP